MLMIRDGSTWLSWKIRGEKKQKTFTVNLENLDSCHVVIFNPVNSTTFVYSVNYLCLTWLNYIFFYFSNSLSLITSMVRALQFGMIHHGYTAWWSQLIKRCTRWKTQGFKPEKMLVVLKPWRSFWSYSKANVFFRVRRQRRTTTETRRHVQQQNLKIGSLEPSYVWITLTRALVSPHRWLKLFFFTEWRTSKQKATIQEREAKCKNQTLQEAQGERTLSTGSNQGQAEWTKWKTTVYMPISTTHKLVTQAISGP